MRSFMEINDYQINKIETNMEKYVEWVLKIQSETSPNNIDIRQEVKFHLDTQSPTTEPWCRPQNDGPGKYLLQQYYIAVRSITLAKYALALLKNNKQDYVQKYLWTTNSNDYHSGAIKYDLDFLVDNYDKKTCDLWEEYINTDIFWNRYTTRHAIFLGVQLAFKMNDQDSVHKYQNFLHTLNPIQTHYIDGYFQQTPSHDRKIDGAVFEAFNNGYSDDNYISPTDVKIAQTIKVYTDKFNKLYDVNQDDNTKQIPGVLIGRYDGDAFFGGNPWVLTTSALADNFYRAAEYAGKFGFSLSEDEYEAWKEVIGQDLPRNDDGFQNAMMQAGDAVLTRLYEHVKNDGMHLSEQIDKLKGKQLSANDLTWSYASTLKALHRRNKINQLKPSFLTKEI